MEQTTVIRHERCKKRLDERVEQLRNQDVRNFVDRACTELEDELGYSRSYLRRIYFEY